MDPRLGRERRRPGVFSIGPEISPEMRRGEIRDMLWKKYYYINIYLMEGKRQGKEGDLS